jgi:hypothetical protein
MIYSVSKIDISVVPYLCDMMCVCRAVDVYTFNRLNFARCLQIGLFKLGTNNSE